MTGRTRHAAGRGTDHLVDGGGLACGELLLRLVSRMSALPTGDVVRLIATDPAAPLDIPDWCHLTGHHYLGPGRETDGRAHYDLEVCARPTTTRPGQPWRRAGHHHPIQRRHHRHPARPAVRPLNSRLNAPTLSADHDRPYLPMNAGEQIFIATRQGANTLGPLAGFGVFCLYTVTALAIGIYSVDRRDA